MTEPRATILIPSYNTGPILRTTVEAALQTGWSVSIVIDGSTDGSPAILEEFAKHPQLRVHRLEQNSGKGAAVLYGAQRARDEGFSHVLTVDADGQHPPEMADAFYRLVQRYPEAAVFGCPIFDESAPALRVQGRKISNFCAHLETLGWGIDDSLFGMRLYPVEALIAVLDETRFARRFDFDPEVAVRLGWKGVPIINLPTPVRYPSADEGGISQFRYFRDNALLTGMHLRLGLGFLLRLPWLALRGENPLLALSPTHPPTDH